MPDAQSRLSCRKDGEVDIIELLDRNILDEAYIQQIGDEITALIESNPNPRVVIDFKNVEHLSSAALGTLINVNNKVRQKDGILRLTSIAPQLLEVFKITKLDHLFHIDSTTDDALKNIR